MIINIQSFIDGTSLYNCHKNTALKEYYQVLILVLKEYARILQTNFVKLFIHNAQSRLKVIITLGIYIL